MPSLRFCFAKIVQGYFDVYLFNEEIVRYVMLCFYVYVGSMMESEGEKPLNSESEAAKSSEELFNDFYSEVIRLNAASTTMETPELNTYRRVSGQLVE